MSKIINSACHILSLKPIVNLKQGLMGFFTVICDTNSSNIIKIKYLLYFYGNTLVSNNILYMKDHVRKPVIYLRLSNHMQDSKDILINRSTVISVSLV